MKYYDFETKKLVNDDRPEIEELAEMYGTIDLLTAYIMRHLNCSEKEAKEKTWEIHECVDRMLDGDDAIAMKDTIDTMEVQGIEFEIRFTNDMNFIHCFHYKESGELVTWLWGWDEKMVIEKCKEFIKLKEEQL